MTFEKDAVTKTLQRALAEAHHVLICEANKIKAARALFVEFRQAAADELRKLHKESGVAISSAVVDLTKLSVKLEAQLGLIEAALRIGLCGCTESERETSSGGNAAAVAGAPPAESVKTTETAPTPTRPAGRSALPSNVVPLRKHAMVVKPPRPGGAA